jgi:hypothetical protein
MRFARGSDKVSRHRRASGAKAHGESVTFLTVFFRDFENWLRLPTRVFGAVAC